MAKIFCQDRLKIQISKNQTELLEEIDDVPQVSCKRLLNDHNTECACGFKIRVRHSPICTSSQKCIKVITFMGKGLWSLSLPLFFG